MTRRRLLLLACSIAVSAEADSAEDAWALLSTAVSALTAGNVAAFLECFDRRMPGYDALRQNVAALLAEVEPRSSVELLANDGNGAVRTIEVLWLLTLVERQDDVSSTTREKRVRCRIEKQGKRWRITSFEPADFFAPPKRVASAFHCSAIPAPHRLA
jgi:murein L,D-transpeptidase YcbB/YkuD